MDINNNEGFQGGATITELPSDIEEINFTGKCFECQEPGHYARDCHKSSSMRQTLQKSSSSPSNSNSSSGNQRQVVTRYKPPSQDKKPYQSGSSQFKSKFNSKRDLIKKGKICPVCRKGGHKVADCFYFRRAKAVMQAATDPSQRHVLYATATQNPFDDQLDAVAEYINVALEDRPEIDPESVFYSCIYMS